MPQVTVTTDSGMVVSFDDAIPTIDDGIAFYVSQLSNLEAKLFQNKYRHIVYQDFVPVDTSDPEYVDEISYISYDAVTAGKFIGSNARDLPKSDINAKKSSIKVGYAGNSYGYSLDELRKSQAMRMPLDTIKAAMSFRGFQEHCQRLAFTGDADRGMTGLFNNGNIQVATSVVDWSTATGPQIVADANAPLKAVWENSAQTHVPNVLAIPADKWAVLSETRMEAGTDTTVLEFLKKNNLFTALTNQPLVIKQNLELQTAGVGGQPRMMAYELNDENLVMKMPMAWRSLAPQPKGLAIDVPCEYKVGGVEFRYPGSAAYRDMV